jgi:hypothetical protein
MQTGSLTDDLENESWESIARMLLAMPISFDNNHKGMKKIGRELGMIRHVICQQLLSYNGNREIDMAFFVSYSKVVARIENDLESKGIRNNEFMLFLKLLLLKVKKQKLIVKKPLEMQNEFKKMKRIVENGNGSI